MNGKYGTSPATVAIGATGHRFLTDLHRIAAGVDEALDRIEQAFPTLAWTVVSPLAEGADRLVVTRALKRSKVRLVVPLPLPHSDYMADFESPESKEEFLCLLAQAGEVTTLPPVSTRDQAYQAVGRYVLDRCDVLIAIWDGRSTQGQGGTGDIVAQARGRGLPLAWVHAGNRKPATQQPATLSIEQGKVSFERFPKQGSLRGEEKEDR